MRPGEWGKKRFTGNRSCRKVRLFCSLLYPHCWGNCNNRGIQVINSEEDDDGEPILSDDLVEASLYLCMWRKTQVIFQKILDHKLQSDQDKVKRVCNVCRCQDHIYDCSCIIIKLYYDF
ncbi:hypothetical protein AVEN_185760-1 [Araneus ventricosus]|uniref:Uncharacterized protein n=1 Tax=Araneus ventricosus TaxID=182803 RepID=A0A4Y2PVI8_ARAVE|nr:hypothetical protein AVEN_185760-1 [Araneus ventricosus]